MLRILVSLTAFLAIFASQIYAYDGLDLNEAEFHPIARMFVNHDSLNVRNKPIDGKIIGQLKLGNTVYIYDRSQDWSRISTESEAPQWVASQYLCSENNCFVKKITTTKVKVNANNTNIKSKPYQSNKFSQSFSSSCSCSSGTFCYGPRGGRYCYTSGGNKSYR